METVARSRPATALNFQFSWTLYSTAVRTLVEPHIQKERGSGWIDNDEKSRFSQIWDFAKVQVLEANRERVGWLSLDTSQAFVYLENFFIDEKFRNRGLGSAVLKWLVDTHRGREIRTSVIAGCRSLALYGRIGFSVGQKDSFVLRLQMRAN